jgi:hypothetical protein
MNLRPAPSMSRLERAILVACIVYAVVVRLFLAGVAVAATPTAGPTDGLALCSAVASEPSPAGRDAPEPRDPAGCAVSLCCLLPVAATLPGGVTPPESPRVVVGPIVIAPAVATIEAPPGGTRRARAPPVAG